MGHPEFRLNSIWDDPFFIFCRVVVEVPCKVFGCSLSTPKEKKSILLFNELTAHYSVGSWGIISNWPSVRT